MNRKLLVIIGVVVLVVVAGFLVLLLKTGAGTNVLAYIKRMNIKAPSGIILFYSDVCDHCQKVNKFIADKKIQEKIAFTSLDIVNNTTNINILADKAQQCGLSEDQIGVPFLWDGKNCIIGDVDIIKFFQEKTVKKP